MEDEEQPTLMQHTVGDGGRLLVSVASAVYDQDRQLASINLRNAFEQKSAIENYTGDEVTVVYQNARVNPDNCPKIEVSADEIERRINLVGNSVTLDVSGITPQEANLIEGMRCFNVDTTVVQEVVARPFTF